MKHAAGVSRDHRVMQKALDRHDSTLRTLSGRYFGYEVTTEGDR